MKTIRGLLLLSGLVVSGPAFAGTVYRCDTPEGRSYVSKCVKGASCEVVSQYTAGKRSRRAPSTAPAVGAVVQTGLVAGSPATGSVPPATVV